jgi:tRNA 2-thiouridine synthesizing protein E
MNMNITLTQDGYLQNTQDWTTEVAEWLAEQQQIELTNAHWEIINLIREFYAKYHTAPTSMRTLIKAVQQQFGADAEQASSIYLYRLFPVDPLKQGILLAGLPKPASCI